MSTTNFDALPAQLWDPGREVLFQVADHLADRKGFQLGLGSDELEAMTDSLEPLKVLADRAGDLAVAKSAGALVDRKTEHFEPSRQRRERRAQLVREFARHRCPGFLTLRAPLGTDDDEPDQRREQHSAGLEPRDPAQ